jgi:NADH-quinone oxidoreductase subunit F
MGAYKALRMALQKTPAEVTQIVKDSGSADAAAPGSRRVRSGRSFRRRRSAATSPCTLICNADESEPGTFKDRYLMWKDPHMFVEGCVIAAYAIGAKAVYIYLRGEFAYIQKRVDEAIADARAKNYIGKGICGSQFDCEVYTHLGAGAYICGEETSLLSSLEGYRGYPKLKPPFPAVEGRVALPDDREQRRDHGGRAVHHRERRRGVPRVRHEKSPGTKLMSCSGHIQKPGVYEINLGKPMWEFINDEMGGLYPGTSSRRSSPGDRPCP